MTLRKGLAVAATGAAALLAAFHGAAQSPPVGSLPPPSSEAARSMLGDPYLKDWPPQDSVLVSPPPPATGSAAEARDVLASYSALPLRGSPRWALAAADADLSPGRAAAAFSCAAGVALGKATPKTDRLLSRAMADLAMSTSVIKRQFKRPRPFMINGQPTCTPEWEAKLRHDGSYPSGHSAIGYGFGLILAELIPERASELVARGRAFGDSRCICNAHWLSDTEEGRVAAALTVARLHAEPTFRKDMDAVREELRKARAAPQACDAESAALAVPG